MKKTIEGYILKSRLEIIKDARDGFVNIGYVDIKNSGSPQEVKVKITVEANEL